MGHLPQMGKKRPILRRRGPILLGSFALGKAQPSTRPPTKCGTSYRPSTICTKAFNP